MFNDDELRSALTKMFDYSVVDGFVDISEGLGDMMTSLANEPSVGLFYVQQHTHNAVPSIVNLRNNIAAKSREIGLHTEDSEDSITMVRSMADCGFPIVDDMIKNITKCLAIMSSRQPRRGLISSGSVSGLKSWDRTDLRGFNSVNQKASDLNSVAKEHTANGSDTMLNVEEELPVSSRVFIGNAEEDVLVDNLIPNRSDFKSFDGFKDDKEARFEERLDGNDSDHKRDQ